MSFKDLLLVLTTYPEPTPASTVDDAIDIAVALGAKISAIACEVKIKPPGSLLYGVVGAPGEIRTPAPRFVV
jgi:hypothetical protein